MSTLIAEAVYVIARTLPERELLRLYNMLDDELTPNKHLETSKKRLITNEEATLFIYKTVFCKK